MSPTAGGSAGGSGGDTPRGGAGGGGGLVGALAAKMSPRNNNNPTSAVSIILTYLATDLPTYLLNAIQSIQRSPRERFVVMPSPLDSDGGRSLGNYGDDDDDIEGRGASSAANTPDSEVCHSTNPSCLLVRVDRSSFIPTYVSIYLSIYLPIYLSTYQFNQSTSHRLC